MNRRNALKLALSSAGGLLAPKLFAGTGTGTVFSASDNVLGQHQLSLFSLANGETKHFAIPFRAHGILPFANTNQALAFGRRPHTQCVLVNTDNGDIVTEMNANPGRHFYGHGCPSADKSVLFTTESEYNEARGVIGIRDAKTLQSIGEYESYGVGPHDIHLMPDGKTLVVANGGIETHPDYGRRKLNIDSMQPSLVYIDIQTGQKIDEYRLADHQLSIRHLTVSNNGDVGVATQYQGNLAKQQPHGLVAWQKNGGELKSLAMPKAMTQHLKGYIADIAYNDITQQLVATAPRGNQILLWDLTKQSRVETIDIQQPSGISPLNNQFILSNAKGVLFSLKSINKNNILHKIHLDNDIAWDNHLTIS